MEPEGILQPWPIEQAQLAQHVAHLLALAEHDRHRAFEVRLAQQPVADEHVPEPLALDVAAAVDDPSLQDAQQSALVATREVEVAGLAADVDLAQQAEEGRRVGDGRRRRRLGPARP